MASNANGYGISWHILDATSKAAIGSELDFLNPAPPPASLRAAVIAASLDRQVPAPDFKARRERVHFRPIGAI